MQNFKKFMDLKLKNLIQIFKIQQKIMQESKILKLKNNNNSKNLINNKL